MKTTMMTIGMLLLAAALYAQGTPVQAGAGNRGFIAMQASPTQLNDDTGLLIGGGFCAILDPHIRVGLTAATLVTNIHGRGTTPATRRNLAFTYGGIYGEYVVAPEATVHLSAYTLLGGGGLLYRGSVDEPENPVAKSGGVYVDLEIDRETDGFFVAEPGVNLEAGVTANLRLCAGLGYRFVQGLETDGVSDAAISGPVGTFMIRFGLF